jgi:hypothetical protein
MFPGKQRKTSHNTAFGMFPGGNGCFPSKKWTGAANGVFIGLFLQHPPIQTEMFEGT